MGFDDSQVSTASTFVGSCDTTISTYGGETCGGENSVNMMMNNDVEMLDENYKQSHITTRVDNNNTCTPSVSTPKLERLRARTKQLRKQGRKKIAETRESLRLSSRMVVVSPEQQIPPSPSRTDVPLITMQSPSVSIIDHVDDGDDDVDNNTPMHVLKTKISPNLPSASLSSSSSPFPSPPSSPLLLSPTTTKLEATAAAAPPPPPPPPRIMVEKEAYWDLDTKNNSSNIAINYIKINNNNMAALYSNKSTKSSSHTFSPPLLPPSISSPPMAPPIPIRISPPVLRQPIVSSSSNLLPPPTTKAAGRKCLKEPKQQGTVLGNNLLHRYAEEEEENRRLLNYYNQKQKRQRKKNKSKRRTRQEGGGGDCSSLYSMYNKNQKCQKLQLENDCLKHQLDLLESRHRDWQNKMKKRLKQAQRSKNITMNDDKYEYEYSSSCSEEEDDPYDSSSADCSCSKEEDHYHQHQHQRKGPLGQTRRKFSACTSPSRRCTIISSRKKKRKRIRRKRKLAMVLIFAPLLVSLTLWFYRSVRNTPSSSLPLPPPSSSYYIGNNFSNDTPIASIAYSSSSSLSPTTTTTPFRSLALMMREGIFRQLLFPENSDEKSDAIIKIDDSYNADQCIDCIDDDDSSDANESENDYVYDYDNGRNDYSNALLAMTNFNPDTTNDDQTTAQSFSDLIRSTVDEDNNDINDYENEDKDENSKIDTIKDLSIIISGIHVNEEEEIEASSRFHYNSNYGSNSKKKGKNWNVLLSKVRIQIQKSITRKINICQDLDVGVWLNNNR